MGCIVAGKTVGEIARSDGVSPSTVCTQLGRARQKLRAKTTVQAAVIYERRKRLEKVSKSDDVLLTDLARGLTTKEIAEIRGLQPDTVSKHIRRQREAFGAKTNEQLVAKYAAKIADLPVAGWASAVIRR